MDAAETMDFEPAVPPAPSQWLGDEEEAEWLRNREELPTTFVGSIIACVAVHLLLLFIAGIGQATPRAVSEQVRMPYRVVSLVHSTVVAGHSLVWMVTGAPSEALFSFDTDTQDLMHISAGYYLYSLLFYALNVNMFPKRILVSMFLNHSAALCMAALQRMFPATIAIRMFHLLSLNNMSMVASSVVYLLSRARVRLVLRIRAALTMLVAFAAALLVDAYSTYTVCAYVFHNDLWRVQVDERVSRYALQFSAGICASAAVVGYTNFVFFSHSVEHVKTRYIGARPAPEPAPPSKPKGVGSRSSERPSAKAKHKAG
eukprot:jgi/Tetstr1/442691/TSEL_030782.t1